MPLPKVVVEEHFYTTLIKLPDFSGYQEFVFSVNGKQDTASLHATYLSAWIRNASCKSYEFKFCFYSANQMLSHESTVLIISFNY